jgi:hypothetical protein
LSARSTSCRVNAPRDWRQTMVRGRKTFTIRSVNRRKSHLVASKSPKRSTYRILAYSLNKLAAIATTIAVVFAGFQFWSDREVRVAQAQLKAVELLLPRYAWRQNVTNATGVGDTSGFFSGGSELASIAFDIEIFNEAGLSYRLFTPAFECHEGSVSLADPSILRSFSLSFPEDQRVAFVNREQPRLQSGVHRLEYHVSVADEALAPDQIVFLELFFSDISIDSRISAPIQSVLARYGAEDSLDFLTAEESNGSQTFLFA